MQWLFGDDPNTQSIVACCTRLKTSTLFEDKISALNELENLAKEHPLQVGVKAMNTICDEVLTKHIDEQILLKKCIEILMLLVLPPEEPYDVEKLPRHPSNSRVYYECNLELLFTPSNAASDRIEVFIKLLRDEFSESIELQYNIIQILTMVLLYKNTVHKLQKELINAYGAINTLSELLNSPHEFIRNSCVILMAHLCCNDPAIQKAFAFEGAFEKVLGITREEEGVEGGMVVQDCLFLMENLLMNNESNQKYFAELGCVEQLKGLLSPTDFLNKQQMTIVSKAVNMLMEITKNCGYIHNTQIALGTIMEPLLNIVSFYAFNKNRNQRNVMEHKTNNDTTTDEGDIDYNLLKQKCLILLRMIVFLNQDNLNLLIAHLPSFKLTYLNQEQNALMSKQINPLLFITKLALNGYKLLPTSTELGGLDIFYNPVISLLSQSLLQCMFSENRNLQKILTESLLRTQLAVHSNQPPQQQQQQQHWDVEFGELVLQILSIHESTQKGFGDPLRYWMITRILSYLVNDNNKIKVLALSKPLTLYNNKQIYLAEIIMNSLITTIDDKSNCDQRIQLGLLLLIITLCYECRDAIYKIFGGDGQQNYMQYFVKLACADDQIGNEYNRGLATYVIALCLEFARDLSPNSNHAQQRPNEVDSRKKKKFSAYLFDIINNRISLDRFKSNLEKLRNTKEYSKMVSVLQKCNQKLPNPRNTNMDEVEKKKRLLIEEIFIHDFDIENDEYLPDKNNRMKINLFDRRFVQQFENIYAGIDKRIISLISSNNQQPQNVNTHHHAPLHSHRAVHPSHTHPSSQATRSSNPGAIGASSEHNAQEINSLRQENEKLNQENAMLQRKVDAMSKNDEVLSAKMSELHELRKQMQQQSHIILQQKQQIQQLTKSKSNGNSDTKESNTNAAPAEMMTKYNTLRKTYEQLNRDHEDLLVFLGDLHEKFEKTQKELKDVRQEKKQLLSMVDQKRKHGQTHHDHRQHMHHNNQSRHQQQARPQPTSESTESKSMDTDHNEQRTTNHNTKTETNAKSVFDPVNDPTAPDLM
eukprot:CAMPEP_0197033194 /NCGR_PEP_ID=MMETSP1384-20130603/11667_1 /TAXON_ID=29189 /ORGANISM="Ammonia sp." /LENGTH=1041 /DNA_ID=CAMNT_0042462969 /DNA_START=5 /DNA_END=3130 /DNA_ORIENTATION=+